MIRRKADAEAGGTLAGHMEITEITAISKSRYNVVLEGRFTFVLYKSELNRFRIRQGKELSESAYQTIFGEILPKRAKLRCMNLLKARDYTQRQLEDKLKRGGYPEDIIAEAVAYVKACGYVNDENYARSFIEYHRESRSRIRMEHDLLQKGISKELIRKTFDALQEDGTEIDEEAVIRQLLEKKKYVSQTATMEEKRKMYYFLCRKGFRSDTINRALLLDIT